MRCQHEASLYDDNAFITLTYDDDNLPDDRSLRVRDFQLFMKRLRKEYGAGIRFYHCGEYGETYGRPHYHACLFNHDFPDKYPWFQSKSGEMVYRSESLEELWPMGICSTGGVTFKSAAYCARYIMKKVTGDMADDHYLDPETGVIRKPEYTTMSRRPGIGKAWFEQFKSDVYPHDFVVMNDQKVRPPKYYDGLYELDHKQSFRKIKARRKANSAQHADNNTPERLKVREKVQDARLSKLHRSL